MQRKVVLQGFPGRREFRVCLHLSGPRHIRQSKQPGSQNLNVDANTPQLMSHTVDPDREFPQHIRIRLLIRLLNRFPEQSFELCLTFLEQLPQ